MFFFRILIHALAVFLIAHYMPGLELTGFGAALLFCLILGILNAVIRPVLVLLTLPFTILSLGIFILFINTFLFWLASTLSFGVHLQSFASAFWGSAFLGLVSLISGAFLKQRKPS